jgi:rhodanese-related sulfurtransferase
MDSEQSFDLDVAAFARLRDAGQSHTVLDVREPWEVAICAFDGSLNIPMRELPAKLSDLPQDRPLVVVCHHGMRSYQVAAWLRRNGFGNAANLAGGIDAWARSVDPSMPSY